MTIGILKVWQQLKREGYMIVRCTVARLMQKLGIQYVWPGKNKQTTRSRDDKKRAGDLVKRSFKALPDEVEAAYLHGAYLEKRKSLMTDWAKFCMPFTQ